MISINEAQKIIREQLPDPLVELTALPEALNRILAEEVQAIEPSPRYTNSAMDGYAVKWEDVKQASESQPAELRIVGESQAGVPYSAALRSGEAIRISTGAMLCDGADTITPVEDTEERNGRVRIKTAGKAGQHIRREGEEFLPGVRLLKKGARLAAPELALLASQGIASVPVYRKPGVSIIVTGSELVHYYSTPKPWQIRDSNGLMLTSAVRNSGGEVLLSAHVGDHFDETVQTLRNAVENSRIIIFSGGVSVGPHDLVKKAAQECGFEQLFWQVKQKPGKPLFFARRENCLFFGLPGNPVSAYMCYMYYIDPVLRFLQGGEYRHSQLTGVAGAPLQNSIKRAHMMRVRLEKDSLSTVPTIYSLERQGSHMLTSLTEADGFVVLEPGRGVQTGEPVEVIPFHFGAI